MASATLPPEPGTPSWRERFLLMQPKASPLTLIVHDSFHDLDAYHVLKTSTELRHFVNQLRAGFTNQPPAGIINRSAPGA